jgi:hypothetical protein
LPKAADRTAVNSFLPPIGKLGKVRKFRPTLWIAQKSAIILCADCCGISLNTLTERNFNGQWIAGALNV